MKSAAGPSKAQGSTRHRSGAGVTVRLIALVMLPVTAMCVLAGSVVVTHRDAAEDAIAVDDGVAALSDLVTLRDGLHAQRTAAAFDVRFSEVGVSRAVATDAVGFDWAAAAVPARGEVSAAIMALRDRSPVRADAMDALYAKIDAKLISATEAVHELDGLLDATVDAVSHDFEQLLRDASDLSVVAALESLRGAIALIDISTPQVIDLSAIWFPAPGGGAQDSAAVLARFGAESASYAATVERVRTLGVERVVADLDHAEADPRVEAFEEAVALALSGAPLNEVGVPVDTDRVAATFQGYLARDVLLQDLVRTATSVARDEARRIAAAERAGFLEWAAGSAALSLVSLGFALLLARSIARPLKDLAGYAHAVNDGRLDAEPSSTRHHGPRETRVAVEVFTQLVANLQLLDAKANALAQCDFDDPVLSQPLPGRLGRSLASSVALLSGSIVERDELQTHLAHLATHDSLTGIGNRPAAIIGIQAAINRTARTGAPTALLFVDLNEFKSVNDSHGHEVGDEVLCEVAARIKLGLRSGDFVARLGGDEFVVIAEDVGGVDGATDVARRIIHAISRPIEVGVLRIRIGAAIGIALTLEGPDDPLRLLARADAAMYRAKHHERSGIEIFDAALQQQMVEREDVETALTAALLDPIAGGLHLNYQPVLDATTSRLVGVEALIRWDRPGHGLLAPDAFIPIAEATALIIAVDRWVLEEATRQLAAWSSVPELADVPVSVNISGRHLLSRQLPDHVHAVLQQSGVDPRRLSIEITETVLLTDLVSAAAELDAIRLLGVSVAIDDFGTGYTSLAHLQQLPIDTIKIDRSFISKLNLRRGSSLVRMVTDLGHAIDINIVAEGVETDEELAALQAIGADHLQGYLLSRPLSPDALSTWAQRRAVAV